MFLVVRRLPADRSGRGGGPNVIVGCVPSLKQSFVTFDRGGPTGPPRSNDFFFGAADDTGAPTSTVRKRPKMAPIGVKLWENAFQTIPNISFFNAEKIFLAKFFDENFRQKNFRRKIDKLPVFAELWIFGRNRQMRLEKLPPKF